MGVKKYVVFMLMILLIAVVGCKKKCDQCHNGGLCDAKNVCECKGQYDGKFCDTLCPIGFEGDTCQILTKSKFIGSWDCTTNGSDETTITHLIQISDDPYFVWTKFSNVAGQAFSLRGTVSAKNRIEFYEQNAQGSYTGKVDGSAVINGDEMSINIRKNGIDYFTKAKRL